jgi:hypothetical protein
LTRGARQSKMGSQVGDAVLPLLLLEKRIKKEVERTM